MTNPWSKTYTNLLNITNQTNFYFVNLLNVIQNWKRKCIRFGDLVLSGNCHPGGHANIIFMRANLFRVQVDLLVAQLIIISNHARW